MYFPEKNYTDNLKFKVIFKFIGRVKNNRIYSLENNINIILWIKEYTYIDMYIL